VKADSPSHSSLPLDGIRVIDLGQIYAVPYCTLHLAALGAEVVKIEPPGKGEFLRVPDLSPGGVSSAFLMLNANKKSVTLNLKHPRGREILLSLLGHADVIVENFIQGAMESLGLGYVELAARFPRLIYASAKGYGPDSRWATLGAMDVTVQAASGFMSITGYSDRPGTKTPATFIDMGTGIHLFAGILAALMQRERTGRGQKVEVAMHDTCIPALTSLIAPVLDGHHLRRLGNRHRGVCPCDVYPTVDGDVMIMCLTESHWRAMLKLLGRQELAVDPRFKNVVARMKIVDEIDSIISAWSKTHTRDEVIAAMMEQGIPCSPVRTVAEVVADPEVAQRAMLQEVEYPLRGKIKVLGSPIKLSDAPDANRPLNRPPALGENTAGVLASIGIGERELKRLRAEGVV
jgi:crotonobetainyl-CoA:carnitine CoA-transferase CaiB-like acyl-CoA transferase